MSIRHGSIVCVLAIIALLAFPTAAWADATTPSPPLPTDLWIAPLMGGLAAFGCVLIAALKTKSVSAKALQSPVFADSAWSAQDSWVTNLTAVGGALTAVFSTSSLGSILNNTNPDGFTLLGLVFGGAAVMAPVIYGAFAFTPSTNATTPTGTCGGAMLASMASLFAAFGLFAEVGQVMSYTIGTTGEKWTSYAGLTLAAAVVAIYAVRSIVHMVTFTPAQNGAVPSLLSQRRTGTL